VTFYPSSFFRLFLFFVFFIGGFISKAGAASNHFTLLDQKQVMAAASEISPSKYPDCDWVTVDEKDTTVYRPDGTGEGQQESYIKVLTERGKQDQRTMQLGFMLPYSTVEVPLLEIIKPDGSIKKVDVAANSKESIDSSQMKSNIYDPNSKILAVSIPDLEVGDILHLVARDLIKRPVIPGEFADETLLEGEGFIRHQVYEIHAPKDKPLKKYLLRNTLPGTVNYTETPEKEGVLLHRWEATGVPRLFREPSMPPLSNVAQLVRVTTTPSWQDISKWYWQLSLSHLNADSPAMKEKVKELTAGASNDLEKVKALFYFVSQNIRYMGLTPEKDRPGYEPHDVCLTFDKKYGVCRDKAGLLVAMLRLAGFKAYPVLVSVGSKKDSEVPDPGFNHAIAAVELKPGEYTLMDPTDEHARDLLPTYDGNQSYLVARPEGETIRTSPVPPPEENALQITTTAALDATGEIKAKSELLFSGINDDAYRGAFAQMKPSERVRFFQSALQNALPGARLTALKLTPENILDVSQKLSAEITFSVGGMIAQGNGKAIATLPWIGGHLGVINFIMQGMDLDKRRFPLLTDVTCGIHETISLKPNQGFSGVESLPTYQPRDDESLSYSQKVSVGEEGKIVCSRDLKLKSVEFSPQQYLALKRTLKELANDARKAPILTLSPKTTQQTSGTSSSEKNSPVESNAKILNVEKRLEVTDGHTARYHVRYAKKILTYVGKTRESEIKIAFNPACEEVHFLRGSVIAATGERHEIAPSEINLLDAESAASAKRYTGGKILVASLPSVEIGSTIEVEYETTMKEKPFLAGFEAFQLPDALEKKNFTLSLPEKLKVEKLLSGGTLAPAESQTRQDEKKSLSWSAEKRLALRLEKQLPPSWAALPGVTYFIGDFQDYLTTLQQTLLARSQSGTQAAAIAKKITEANKTKIDTLRGIRDFVSSNIRGAGPSFTELPLSELSAADVTLADGYGHQADRAILLHSLLTAAGFQPEFVLASDLPPIPEFQKTASTFPLPEEFSVPLVKVTLDGVSYYLNDTDQYAELGTTPHDHMLALDLSSQTYDEIHSVKEDKDRIEISYDIQLDAKGGLQMRVTRKYYGTAYNQQSRFYAELRPEERKRHYQKLISQITQGARPLGELTTRFDTYPGTEEFSVQVDHFAVLDGDNCYFSLPFTTSLFQLPGDETRTLPLEISRQQIKAIHATLTLPSEFPQIVIAPVSRTLQAPSGTGRVQITTQKQEGKFLLDEKLETAPGIVSPADYPALRALESSLRETSSSLFLLKKNPSVK